MCNWFQNKSPTHTFAVDWDTWHGNWAAPCYFNGASPTGSARWGYCLQRHLACEGLYSMGLAKLMSVLKHKHTRNHVGNGFILVLNSCTEILSWLDTVFFIELGSSPRVSYQWFDVKVTELHCWRTGVTSLLHQAIDIMLVTYVAATVCWYHSLISEIFFPYLVMKNIKWWQILQHIIHDQSSNQEFDIQINSAFFSTFKPNIRRALIGNKIVDHSDVVGASPVGAAPTTSSFSA